MTTARNFDEFEKLLRKCDALDEICNCIMEDLFDELHNKTHADQIIYVKDRTVAEYFIDCIKNLLYIYSTHVFPYLKMFFKIKWYEYKKYTGDLITQYIYDYCMYKATLKIINEEKEKKLQEDKSDSVPSPAEVIQFMNECIDKYVDDIGVLHEELDGVMCDTLCKLGYSEAVEIFDKADKWYE